MVSCEILKHIGHHPIFKSNTHDFVPLLSQIRTLCKCCSARPRSVSFTAWRRRRSLTISFRPRTWYAGAAVERLPDLTTDCALKLSFLIQDIMIYDEEADKLQHITFSEALYAANIGSANNQISPKDAFGIADLVVGGPEDALIKRSVLKVDATNNTNVFRNVEELKADSEGTAWVSKLALTVATGIWMPVCITIARPFIEHLMMSAIMTVSGRDTGATLFGPADMRERHDHESTHIPVHPSPY